MCLLFIVVLMFFYIQVVSGLCYVSTYEGVRHMLENNGVKDNKIKALGTTSFNRYHYLTGVSIDLCS